MEIKSLENTPMSQLFEAFNKAFADYIIPLKLTEEQFATKANAESITMKYSVGAFKDDTLIGFILHGRDTENGGTVVYNAGTGVLPAYRGLRLTARMYEYLLPMLIKDKVSKVMLEVIESNHAALKVYRSLGFKVSRTLNCYKGTLATRPAHLTHFRKDLRDLDWTNLETFWDWPPTWQNSITAIKKASDKNSAILALKDQRIIGYLIYSADTNRIHQFAVHKDYRNTGLGHSIFDHYSRIHGKQTTIINIDDSSTDTVSFLTGMGLEVFIRQFEMQLELNV